MGIFSKLFGKDEEPYVSDWENWRRAVVRTGNLDWTNQPIDRFAGAPIAPSPELKGFRERIADFLDQIGGRIERPNPNIPVMPQSLFEQNASTTETAYNRRFRESRRLSNNADSLK
jgi:hypothetical protein